MILSRLLPIYSSVFLLATNGLFAKSIPLDSVHISHHRSVIAALTLFAIIAFQSKETFKLARRSDIFGVYALGVLLGSHWITYFQAMQVSTVAIGMIALFSYPVITVFFESILERSAPSTTDIAAGMLTIAGVIILAWPNLTPHLGTANIQSDDVLAGIGWGLLSAALFAVRNSLQKRHFPNISSAKLMTHQLIAVVLMLTPFINFDSAMHMKPNTILLLVLLGIFSTAGAHTLLSYSLKILPAKSVALISCTTPVLGALLAWLVLHENPSMYTVLGGGIILAVSLYESIKQSRD